MQKPSSTEPRLTIPSLFVLDFPGNVTEEHLRKTFKTYQLTRISITDRQLNGGRRRGTRVARIDFSTITVAEKALALLYCRPIPDIEPPVLLKLSPTQNRGPPPFSGNPRLVKLLPSHYTEPQLYDLLRPFGAIGALRIDEFTGGTVQFWTEEEACAAELRVRAAFARGHKITLQAYNPCNLYCANLSPEVNETSLRESFEEFGTVTEQVSVVLYRRSGISRGIGFVSYRTPEEALVAAKIMDGATLGSQEIIVRFHEPRGPALPKKAREAELGTGTGEANFQRDDASPVTDVEDGAESMDSAWGASNDTSWKTSVGVEPEEDSKIHALLDKLDRAYDELESQRIQIEEMKVYQAQLERQKEEAEEALKVANGDHEVYQSLLRFQSEDWQRKFEIADSQRKTLELERDRPLWEEAKRRREAEEREEKEKAEAMRRKAEVEEFERRMRELLAEEKKRTLEENRRKEQEEAERKERARQERVRQEKERRDKERREANFRLATAAEQLRCQQRDSSLWGAGAWTKERALERFIYVSDEFDRIKFSEEQPLTLGSTPWPVLTNPKILDATQISWANVEAFFTFVKVSLAPQVYNALVERAHRMFHPDKWRSRKVLTTVMDDGLRISLERAVNVVSQAITPLWRQSRGYD